VRSRNSAKRSLTANAQASRDAATSVSAGTKAPPIPEFSAQESLDELRTLASSAGAVVVGEVLQKRDRPDPATLIGGGKLEEIDSAILRPGRLFSYRRFGLLSKESATAIARARGINFEPAGGREGFTLAEVLNPSVVKRPSKDVRIGF